MQPFLEMVNVTVGLHPKGTVKTGLGIFAADNVPQVVVQLVLYPLYEIINKEASCSCTLHPLIPQLIMCVNESTIGMITVDVPQ